MDIRVYQVNLERDENNNCVAFRPYACLKDCQGSQEIDESVYDCVFAGEVPLEDLEDVFEMFNEDLPESCNGRSMSVSDIVEVRDGEEKGFFYCDAVGFKKVAFNPEKAELQIPQKMKVVAVEPGCRARITEIGSSLEAMSNFVKGDIETYYPFEEEVCIVCNDSGKIDGMKPNRAIYGEENEMVDIVFGPFFICDCKGEFFASLSEEQLEKYRDRFLNPERFYRDHGRIRAETYEPEIKETETERVR